jgi:hypothetical protein
VAIEPGLLRAGAGLFEKPFSPEALAHKIREVLDDRSQAA